MWYRAFQERLVLRKLTVTNLHTPVRVKVSPSKNKRLRVGSQARLCGCILDYVTVQRWLHCGVIQAS